MDKSEIIRLLTPDNPWQVNIEVGMSPDTCSFCNGWKPRHKHDCAWVEARRQQNKVCKAQRDGDCTWALCPQKFNYKTTCQLAIAYEEY